MRKGDLFQIHPRLMIPGLFKVKRIKGDLVFYTDNDCVHIDWCYRVGRLKW